MKNILLLILFGIIFLSCSSEDNIKAKEDKKSENNPKNNSLPYLGVQGKDHIIPQFDFLNQDSIWVNNNSYKGKVWIAEFFFSTCPTICPIMNTQMNRLVRDFENLDSIIQFLSFSINPGYDSPSVLKNYAKRNGFEFDNWDFLTGKPEESVHALGVKSFLVHAGKGSDEDGGYAHSGSFTLVDEQGHVRGVYQITNGEGNKDENEYIRLTNDLKILLRDEYRIKK